MNLRILSGCLLVVVACPLSAQERLPVPDATALAAAQEAFLEILARAGAASSHELLDLAHDPKSAPVVRWLLCQHGERVARVALDLEAGLRAADESAAIFAIDGTTARADCLRRFAATTGMSVQALVGAWLGEAERALDGGTDPAASLASALALAAADSPPGLAALAHREAAAIVSARDARNASAAAPDDFALRGRALAFHCCRRDQGLVDLERGGARLGRVAAAKIGRGADDPLAPVRAAEHWLSLSRSETDRAVQRNLQRRALALLDAVALACWPRTDADTPPALAGPEGGRALALQARVTDDLRAFATPGVDAVRFSGAADLERLVVTNGEWKIEDGLLLGRSTGAATRATLPFAFRTIDCVTIRAGIRSPDGLNLRVAVGDVNLLLNWEVADENHCYFGDACVRVGPRCLVAGTEHTIRLRQIGDRRVVLIDDKVMAVGEGKLGGPITVYPALGSEIFVRSIDVVGDVAWPAVVEGPTGTTR
ncbi:MAG: hypothetical protein KDC98_12885 [Planctomycetes bacterium]|nr:hypothetical protein [Planctomycetota bacterium]